MVSNYESTDEFDNLLLSAVHQGDVDLLQTHLSTVLDANIYLNRVYNDTNQQKCTFMMIACLNGFEDIISMLLNSFQPDCEVLNTIKITLKDKTIHTYEDVAVLWAATVMNNFKIVKLLVKHGAQVNHKTKTNSTPIRCACSHGNIDMVRYLIENGADIHIAKNSNHTNLLLSVAHEHISMVTYLVNELGCDVNECNDHGRSPLYIAVDRGSLELVQFLLDHGAHNVRLKYDQMSPLMHAAEKRRTDLIDAISSHCTVLEQIEGEELLGSAFTCTELGDCDYEESFKHYSRALELRSIHHLPTPLQQSTSAVFNHRQQCQTIDELNEIHSNPEEMYIEGLLIRERLLGPTNVKYRRSLWYRGVSLIRLKQYHAAVALWWYELELRRKYSTPINKRKLRPFATIFAKIVTKSLSLPINTVCRVLTVIVDELEHNSKDFDDIMHTLLFIITVTSRYLTKTIASDDDLRSFYRIVHSINQHRFVTREGGSSLLHLCLKDNTSAVDSTIEQICKYPCGCTVRTLLQCGADVNVTDAIRNTPLHVFLSGSYRVNESILKILCDANPHLDYANVLGETPIDIISDPNIKQLLEKRTKLSLKCLCARLIQKNNISFHGKVSNSLVTFVEIH